MLVFSFLDIIYFWYSFVKIIIFIAKVTASGINSSPKKGSHPPRKKIALSADMRIILLYSARKNRAKPLAEYSTL